MTMNNTTTNYSSSSSDDDYYAPANHNCGQSFGVFIVGAGVSVVLLLLIFILTYASYLCSRPNTSSGSGGRGGGSDNPSTGGALAISGGSQDYSIAIQLGLDDATLRSYPTLLYSQAKLQVGDGVGEDSTASCCSICLADYKETDVVRVLPDCGHVFHVACVDRWLRLHPTCPVCRNSPVPTPLSTPLAHVVP